MPKLDTERMVKSANMHGEALIPMGREARGCDEQWEVIMRWSRITCVLALSVLIAVAGCGSSGFDGQDGADALTLSFQRFTGEGIEQQDAVGGTSADVDVCQTICGISGIFTIEFEEFTSTRVNAVFVNRGKADILLDSYTVSIPGSGLPDEDRSVSSLLPGGRCNSDAQRQCAFDSECVGGGCIRQETMVDILLYDFVFKELIRGDGECPRLDPNTFLIIPGTVLPQTYQTFLTFSGSDETGERFTISASYLGAFADFNNCEE